jgi:hypothetical protein
MATTLGFAPPTSQPTSYEDYLKQLQARAQQGGQPALSALTTSQPTLPYDPKTASGESFNPQTGKWDPVAAGGQPQAVYYGPTDQFYYQGKPITKQQYQQLQLSGPNAVGGTFSPDTLNQNLTNLRFGQTTTALTSPTIGATAPVGGGGGGGGANLNIGTATGYTPTAAAVAAPPSVTAPSVSAAQGGFTDFDALQQAIYHSEFDPVQRELQRQQGLAGEQLRARLSQAGLAESGTGVGQEVRQDEEFYRQITAAASDAANKSAVQRYGMEYTQSMDNAKLRQEANLANAGFSLQAQVENAKNLLTANVTTAQLRTQASIAGAANQTQAGIAGLQARAQLAAANIQAQSAQAIAQAQIASAQAIAQAQLQVQTMGLSLQQEQAARGDYLKLLGLQEADLARMDNFTLNSTSMFYDTYLKQLGILTQAGQVSFGKSDQSSASSGFQVPINISL